MQYHEITSALEAVLFAAGEPVEASRVAKVLGVEDADIFASAEELKSACEREGRGVRLLRLGAKLQLCSAPEYAQVITRALEQRKPPKLSNAALEVLAITAYFQPVTRAYIDQVRGVDSSYTVGLLTERGLIEPAGKLDVPGRPTLYKTGDAFLRTMNISDLSELPPLPDTGTDEGIIALQNKIEALRSGEMEGQMRLEEPAGDAEEKIEEI